MSARGPYDDPHLYLADDIQRLRADLDKALERIAALESQAPQARQLQYEADIAAADLAESGYGQQPPVGTGRHGPGCGCPYCPPDEDEVPA